MRQPPRKTLFICVYRNSGGSLSFANGRKRMKKETYTISYRLDGHYQQRLEALAVRNGISQHEQARRLLVESLNGANGQEQVLEQVAGLRAEVASLTSIRQQVDELRDDITEALEWMTKKIGAR